MPASCSFPTSSLTRWSASTKGATSVSWEPIWQLTPITLDIGQRAGHAVFLEGFLDVDPELVLLQARGDVGMGLGIDIRVDPQGDGRFLPQPSGDLIDLQEFLGRFHVEHQDAALQGVFDFIRPLPHPRINDPVGTGAGFHGPEQLSPRRPRPPRPPAGRRPGGRPGWSWP